MQCNGLEKEIMGDVSRGFEGFGLGSEVDGMVTAPRMAQSHARLQCGIIVQVYVSTFGRTSRSDLIC